MAPILATREDLAYLARRAVVTVGPALIRHQLVGRDLKVRGAQGVTLGVIAAYVVIIAILWNIPYVRYVLWPFKMLVIAFHEFSHAITACCTGGRVESISLDPNEGGVTHMRGGIPAITLPAGYLGSSVIGMLLTFCGFDIMASKVASIVLGVCFLLTLWWGKKDWLTILTILLAVGLLVGFWFIAHAEPLRYLVLFIGVMSSLYSVWDIGDDLIFRKVNSSDASQFAKRYGGSSQCWGVIWSIVSIIFGKVLKQHQSYLLKHTYDISCVFQRCLTSSRHAEFTHSFLENQANQRSKQMAIGIVAGIAAFPESAGQQQKDSEGFAPTV